MNDAMIGQMYRNGQIGIVSACRMLCEQGYNRKNRREIMARWLTPRTVDGGRLVPRKEVMKNKDGKFVYVDGRGGEWVQYEYFEKINAIALESKLIIERIQKLLGVYTTTEAFARIVELQTSNQQVTQTTNESLI